MTHFGTGLQIPGQTLCVHIMPAQSPSLLFALSEWAAGQGQGQQPAPQPGGLAQLPPRPTPSAPSPGIALGKPLQILGEVRRVGFWNPPFFQQVTISRPTCGVYPPCLIKGLWTLFGYELTHLIHPSQCRLLGRRLPWDDGLGDKRGR